jgi:HSP20 family molecular chaperone IbpA
MLNLSSWNADYAWLGNDASKIFKDLEDYTVDFLMKKRISKGTYKQVTDNEEELKIIIRAAGLTKEDISIDITDRKLAIKNQKTIGSDSYLVDDIDLVFQVPECWDLDAPISAKLENGILTITLNKAQNKAKKTITIQ